MRVCYVIYVYLYTYRGEKKRGKAYLFCSFLWGKYVGVEFLGYTAMKLGLYKGLMKDVYRSHLSQVYSYFNLMGTLAEKLQTFLTS